MEKGSLLPPEQQKPHHETNENGYWFVHPGYREIKCIECGRLNIQSVAVPAKNKCIGECKKEKV